MSRAERRRAKAGLVPGQMSEVLRGINGMEKFIDAFMAASDDTEICVGLGTDGTGERFVMASVDEITLALLPSESRIFAGVVEEAMHKFASFPETRGFDDLILGLRTGADIIEKEARK